MPEFGLFTVDQVAHTGPQTAPLFPALPWELGDVRLIKCTYEVDLDATRRLLPTPLSRPTPPFGTLLVTVAEEGPLGPFRLAAQTVACRWRTYGRVYVVQAVCDSPVATAALRETWGYPVVPGTVEIEDDESSVSGRVLAADDETVATFRISSLEGAEAHRIIVDPELCVRTQPRFAADVDPEKPTILQLNRAYALRDPRRGTVDVRFRDGGSRYPWSATPVTNMIIGIDTMANLEYAPTEYVLGYESDEADVLAARR
jgi:acetoacetate decarboxylase